MYVMSLYLNTTILYLTYIVYYCKVYTAFIFLYVCMLFITRILVHDFKVFNIYILEK